MSIVTLLNAQINNSELPLSIRTDGMTADASAILDVQSFTKGMLIPRMTSVERNGISSPATGLMVFVTTDNSFYYYDGINWVTFANKTNLLTDNNGDTKVQVEESPDDDIIRFDVEGTEQLVLTTNPANIPRLELDNAQSNILIGKDAGHLIVTGKGNIGIGKGTLYHSDTMSNLVAIGDSALYHNGAVSLNTFPFPASANTAIGAKALYANTGGFYNTAIGDHSLYSNDTGYYNTAVGSRALELNTSGNSNTAIGTWALSSNTNGEANTASGQAALTSNTGGNNNSAYGWDALVYNTFGNNNTACGFSAMLFNTDGSSNVAIGMEALYANKSQNNLVAVGDYALHSNYSGIANTAVGSKTLFLDTSGSYNTALGYEVLYLNRSGYNNTGNGYQTLYNNSTGQSNAAFGSLALYNNSIGDFNTALGNTSLYSNTSGSYNTAIGNDAYFTSNLDNTTCVGYFSGNVVNVNDRIEIGNTSVGWIGGQALWDTYSDARIKTRIRDNVPGLSFISRLRPVTYHLDIHKQNAMCYAGKTEGEWDSKYDIEKELMTGFVAQEVEQAAEDIGYDFSGVQQATDEVGMYSLSYASFVVPLVKAVQEQQQIIEMLDSKIQKLHQKNSTTEAKLKDVMDEMKEMKLALEKLTADKE